MPDLTFRQSRDFFIELVLGSDLFRRGLLLLTLSGDVSQAIFVCPVDSCSIGRLLSLGFPTFTPCRPLALCLSIQVGFGLPCGSFNLLVRQFVRSLAALWLGFWIVFWGRHAVPYLVPLGILPLRVSGGVGPFSPRAVLGPTVLGTPACATAF